MKMKKLLLSLMGMAGVMVASPGYSADSFDLFTYENKHSSMTVDMDTSIFSRFSVQVFYSTPVINDALITTPDINTDINTFKEVGHGFATAQPVLLATAPATAPSPLSSGTTYYIIKVSDELVQLATTYAQAVAKEPIDILTAPAGIWTLKALPLAIGTSHFTWAASNDGTNWVTTGSSQTLTSIPTGSASRLFDWGSFAYRYLRFDFKGPTAGVIKLRAVLFGKKE